MYRRLKPTEAKTRLHEEVFKIDKDELSKPKTLRNKSTSSTSNMSGHNSIEVSSDCVSNEFFSKIIQKTSQEPDKKPRATTDEKVISDCVSSDVQDFTTQNTYENPECLIGTFKDGSTSSIHEDDTGDHCKPKPTITRTNTSTGNPTTKKLSSHELFIIVATLVLVQMYVFNLIYCLFAISLIVKR